MLIDSALDSPLKHLIVESEGSPELLSESFAIPAPHPISTSSCQSTAPILSVPNPSRCTHFDITGFEAQLVADQDAIRLSVMVRPAICRIRLFVIGS